MLFNSVAEITDGEENVSITVRHWSLTQTPSLASMAFCQLFQKIGIPMAQLVSIKPIAAKTERVHILGTSRRVYRILRRVRAARSPCIGQIDTPRFSSPTQRNAAKGTVPCWKFWISTFIKKFYKRTTASQLGETRRDLTILLFCYLQTIVLEIHCTFVMIY